MTYFAPSKSGFLGVAAIEHKMRNHGFDPHFHAAVVGCLRFSQCIATGSVNHVDMRAGQAGKRGQVMHAFGFDDRRARGFVPLGAGFSLADKFLLKLRNHFGIFAVGGDNHAPAFGQFQCAIQFRIVEVKRAFVGQKNFERRDAVVDDFFQFVGGSFVEAADAEVKGVIAGRLSGGFRLPQLVRFDRIVVASRADHFDQRRGAADQRRAAGGFVIVFGERAHEGQIDMDVRIDETWKHILSGGVDHLGAWRGRKDLAQSR